MTNTSTGGSGGGPSYDPRKIRYLAFMGGGGKGMAYCGAIEELERQFHLKPLFPAVSNASPWFQGVSGASAGAITALLVSLSYESNEIADILQRKPFIDFFDGPGDQRHQRVRYTNTDHSLVAETRRNALPSWLQFVDNPNPSYLVKTIADMVAVYIVPKLGLPQTATNKVMTNIPPFLSGLLCDGAMFLGENARNYMSGLIDGYLQKLNKMGTLGSGKFGPDTITFSELYRLTGVKLVLTGTNISNRKSLYFSADYTPDFPVCGAVLISMSIPLVFKPVWVDCAVNKNNPNNINAMYRGLYVDGGVLNNFPIHAFDTDEFGSSGIKKLNTMTLGLKLVPGNPPGSQQSNASVTPPEALLLDDILKMILDTMLTPSSEGQVRSSQEALQTVDLYTSSLSTLDFDPSPASIKQAHDYAVKAVNQHMAQTSISL
jgi:predicted acylesterase/phospholipase RssA